MTIGAFDRRDLDQRSSWTMRTSRSDGAPFAPSHRWAVCIGEGGCRRSELVHPDRNFGSTGLQCRLGGDAGGHLASSNHDGLDPTALSPRAIWGRRDTTENPLCQGGGSIVTSKAILVHQPCKSFPAAKMGL